MTFLASIFFKLSLLAIAVGGVFICQKCFKMKDDNVIEETIEEVLKDQVGVDIDLTPATPEVAAMEISDLLDFTKDSIE